jgi:BirA family biotin operon repressor/biotin-[acetyl-CoA-carboxylase] ligase
LRHAPPTDTVTYPAAALNIDDKSQFIPALTAIWAEWHDIYLRDGFDAIRAEWLRHAHALGQEITVRTPQQNMTGVFRGLDDNGNLLLTQGTQVVKVTTADVLVS